MKALTKNKPVSNGGEGKAAKPEGLTISQLSEIKNALTNLSQKQSALGYQWARNLALVSSEIKNAAEAYNKSRISLLEKDEEGNPLQYLASTKDGEVTVLKDGDGNKIIFKKGMKLKEEQTFATQIPEEHMEKWNQIHKEYIEELHCVNWHKIPEERLEKVAEDEKIEGSLLVVLLGNVI